MTPHSHATSAWMSRHITSSHSAASWGVIRACMGVQRRRQDGAAGSPVRGNSSAAQGGVKALSENRACGALRSALATHPFTFPATRFNTALTPRREAFGMRWVGSCYLIQVACAENTPLHMNRSPLLRGRLVPLVLVSLLGGCGDARHGSGEAAVKQGLRDPRSAEFREQFIGVRGDACGEVNARNAFGGYVGFRRYWVAKDGRVTLEGERLSPEHFEDVWRSNCR